MANKPVKVIDGDLNVLGTIYHSGIVMPTIDNVGEYSSIDYFPEIGQSGIIYIDKNDNRTYRWDKNKYVLLNDTAFKLDNATTNIDYTFEKLVDKTFSAKNVSSISLTIPEDAGIGFQAGAVIKTSDLVPAFELTNLSAFPEKLIQFGTAITSYVPAPNATVTFLLYNDGINNNILVYEVPDA